LRLPKAKQVDAPNHRDDDPCIEATAKSHARTFDATAKLASDSD
jgi:hypothetical protein